MSLGGKPRPEWPKVVRRLCAAHLSRFYFARGLHCQVSNRAVNRSGGGSTKVRREASTLGSPGKSARMAPE
jgi:hypothetical protein